MSEKPRPVAGQRWMVTLSGREYILHDEPGKPGQFRRHYTNGDIGTFTFSAEETLMGSTYLGGGSPTPAPVSDGDYAFAQGDRDNRAATAPVSVRVGQRRRFTDVELGPIIIDELLTKAGIASARIHYEESGRTDVYNLECIETTSVLLDAPTSPQPSPVGPTIVECRQYQAGYSSLHCRLERGHVGQHVGFNAEGETLSWVDPSPVAPTPVEHVLVTNNTDPAKNGVYRYADGQWVRVGETPKTALEAIQARKKPDPYICPVDDWDLLPDV